MVGNFESGHQVERWHATILKGPTINRCHRINEQRLFLLSIYALALLLPSLAEFSQAAAPWLLALHQNWFPRLTNPGIPAQKQAACTKFANSEIPARNFAKLPALKNYASHNGALSNYWGKFESGRSWKIVLVIKIPSNVQRFPPIKFF